LPIPNDNEIPSEVVHAESTSILKNYILEHYVVAVALQRVRSNVQAEALANQYSGTTQYVAKFTAPDPWISIASPDRSIDRVHRQLDQGELRCVIGLA
jgi:hypothetical protein